MFEQMKNRFKITIEIEPLRQKIIVIIVIFILKIIQNKLFAMSLSVLFNILCLLSFIVESFNKAVLFVTGLEKPSATDQCTSTTELHLSSATKVADIPQDFLNYHLSKRMSVIPIQFYRKICIKLDTLRELLWDDYRLLAEKVGLDKDTILLLGQQKNQTEIILQKFDAQRDCSIGRFKAILVEMERNDVETVIEEWLLYEWNKEQNNNSSLANCGRGPNYKLQSLV